METLLEVNDLWKKYSRDLSSSVKSASRELLKGISTKNKENIELRNKEFWALQGIDFTVRRGEVLAILGHNGAGKSTLLKCIAGKLRLDRGSVNTHGEIGYLLEMSAGFSPTMSGRDNVSIRGRLMGKRGKALAHYVAKVEEFSGLDEFFDMPVQFYSSGMKSRLGFSASSVISPDILIIDEVLAVGDLAFRMQCYERINEIARNAAVLFVSHSIGQVARLCDRGIYLQKGKALFDGDVQRSIAMYQEHLGIVSGKKTGYSFNKELVNYDLVVGGEVLTPGGSIEYGRNAMMNINVNRFPKNVQIRIVLKDASGGILADWNSARSKLVWPEGHGVLTVDLGRFELCPGSYGIIVQIMSESGAEHLCLSESLSFRMTGELYYAVAIQRQANWNFD